MKQYSVNKRLLTVIVFFCLCVITVAQTAASEVATPSVKPQVLSFPTNNWGRDFTAYKADVAKLSECVMVARKAGSSLDFGKWYLTIVSLPVPTNDVSSYGCWFIEKSQLLRTTAKYLQDVSNTNCWIAAATQLGEIRSGKRTKKEIMSMLQADDAERTIGISERRKWFRTQTTIQAVLAHAETYLQPAVVETIGCGFLPRLTEPDQRTILSLICVRARLTELEISQIEGAIRKSVDDKR